MIHNSCHCMEHPKEHVTTGAISIKWKYPDAVAHEIFDCLLAEVLKSTGWWYIPRTLWTSTMRPRSSKTLMKVDWHTVSGFSLFRCRRPGKRVEQNECHVHSPGMSWWWDRRVEQIQLSNQMIIGSFRNLRFPWVRFAKRYANIFRFCG